MHFKNFYDLVSKISDSVKGVSSDAIKTYNEQIKNLEIELSRTSDESERRFIYEKIAKLNEHISEECKYNRDFQREVLICGTVVILSGIGYLASNNLSTLNT